MQRIDRLDPKAKRTLSAAAVIGSRFDLDLLTVLDVEPVVDDLVAGQFIDQVRFTREPEYVFRHPLVRAVAYESQLKSDRATLHRRVASAIEQRDSAAVDENAALIAEHLETAGDLHAAYGWHMRAGAWATTRDIAAAYLSWERARRVADALPADDGGRTAMRIAPRALQCGNASRIHVDISGGLFEELRELCAAAGDKASLAIGMVGLAVGHMKQGRMREASRLASETMALVESIGDPTLTVGLGLVPVVVKMQTGEVAEVLRLSQRVIDLADGDPAKGNLIVGSPFAVALAARGTAHWALGRPGSRDDIRQAVALARRTDPMSHAMVIAYTYSYAIPTGVLVADDSALRDIDEALQIAERSSDDLALALARSTMAVALMHRNSRTERERGLALLGQVRGMCVQGRYFLSEIPMLDVYTEWERARRGDHDAALPLLRGAVDDLFLAGQLGFCIVASAVLVGTLLDRGADGDVADAEAAIERLAVAPADDGLVIRDIWLLRLRTLLSRARGDETGYRDHRDRYRAMATSLGFEGHIAWAEAMP